MTRQNFFHFFLSRISLNFFLKFPNHCILRQTRVRSLKSSWPSVTACGPFPTAILKVAENCRNRIDFFVFFLSWCHHFLPASLISWKGYFLSFLLLMLLFIVYLFIIILIQKIGSNSNCVQTETVYSLQYLDCILLLSRYTSCGSWCIHSKK